MNRFATIGLGAGAAVLALVAVPASPAAAAGVHVAPAATAKVPLVTTTKLSPVTLHLRGTYTVIVRPRGWRTTPGYAVKSSSIVLTSKGMITGGPYTSPGAGTYAAVSTFKVRRAFDHPYPANRTVAATSCTVWGFTITDAKGLILYPDMVNVGGRAPVRFRGLCRAPGVPDWTGTWTEQVDFSEDYYNGPQIMHSYTFDHMDSSDVIARPGATTTQAYTAHRYTYGRVLTRIYTYQVKVLNP